MRYLNADEMSGMADADLGDVHAGPDGNLYEWVEGVDAWGTPIGFWQGLGRVEIESPAVAGLGALYQASDGSLYQVQGLEDDEPQEADAPASDDDKDAAAAPKMGPGRPGEIRVGPDRKKYRWVLGVGAGGKRTGFWKRMRPRPGARPGGPGPQARAAGPARRPQPRGQAPGRKRKPFLKRLLPIAKVAASFIPIPGAGKLVKAGLTVADKLLTRKGVSGYGLGALYQAPDGSLYQVQGFADEDLRGLYENERIEGLELDDDVDGFAVDEDLNGPRPDGEIQGFADDVDGLSTADRDLGGYVRDDRVGEVEAYVPTAPPRTRMFDPSRELPEIWKPLW